MQIPTSDIDFFERKIARLQKDIASLNQQLNVARSRLRSAQDFQIKYELLLRQSQQENLRMRKIEEVERARVTELISIEIQKINQQWIIRTKEREQAIKQQQSQQRLKLIEQLNQLTRKNKQISQKAEQMDVLLFKNKKIAKDLQSLEEIIQENRNINQRQRQEELQICKETMTKKFNEKMQKQRQLHQQKYNNLQHKYQALQLQLLKLQLQSQQRQRQKQPQSQVRQQPLNITRPAESQFQSQQKQNQKQKQSVQQKPFPLSGSSSQLDKLAQLLRAKDQYISRLQGEKIELEEKHSRELRQFKEYHRELEEKIYLMQSEQQVQIINLRARMQSIRQQQLLQHSQSLQSSQQIHAKQLKAQQAAHQKQVDQMQNRNKIDQGQIYKLKEDKQKLQKKVSELKEKLKEYQSGIENGETQALLGSFKNIDKKEDQLSGYENGVTFLERQLRKTLIKLQKKNLEIKQLVSKLNTQSAQSELQLKQTKQAHVAEIHDLQQKISQMDQHSKSLTENLRKKQRQLHTIDSEYSKKLNQLAAQNRSLINLNNDLQRDYNRILESKKLIEKSFREERERSVTSKSQIAVAKKQKWLELERQKNQIEVIYKEKEEQIKTAYQIVVGDLRAEVDKLKRENQLTSQQLSILKQKMKKQESQGQKQKQNIYSDFNKKLATVNLQIALTQNLYNQMIKTKSRIKKSHQTQKQKQKQPQPPQTQGNKPPANPNPKIQLQSLKKDKSIGGLIKQIDKLSENQSQEQRSKSKGSGGLQHPEVPFIFDSEDDIGGTSPTFKMVNSFNPRFNFRYE